VSVQSSLSCILVIVTLECTHARSALSHEALLVISAGHPVTSMSKITNLSFPRSAQNHVNKRRLPSVQLNLHQSGICRISPHPPWILMNIDEYAGSVLIHHEYWWILMNMQDQSSSIMNIDESSINAIQTTTSQIDMDAIMNYVTHSNDLSPSHDKELYSESSSLLQIAKQRSVVKLLADQVSFLLSLCWCYCDWSLYCYQSRCCSCWSKLATTNNLLWRS